MTASDDAEGTDAKSARQKMGDGIRQGIGVLSAFKDALEETIQEARERGDLSSDRAKEVMKGALEKAQAAASGAKERLDFVNQGELDALQGTVDAIKDRVAALEEKVFGSRRGTDAAAEGSGGGGEGEGEGTA